MTTPGNPPAPTLMDEAARNLGVNTALNTCIMFAVQANPKPDALVARIDDVRQKARAELGDGKLDTTAAHAGIEWGLGFFEKMLTHSTKMTLQDPEWSSSPDGQLANFSRMIGMNRALVAALELAVETNPRAGLLRLLMDQARVMIEGRLLDIEEETVWDGVDWVLEAFDDMLPATPDGADWEAALDSLGPPQRPSPEKPARQVGAPEMFAHLVGKMVALPMILQAAADGHPRPALLLERLDGIRKDALGRLGDTGDDWGTKAIDKVVGDLERGLRGQQELVSTDFGEGAPDLTQAGEPQDKMNASFAWMMGQVHAIEVALEVCVATNPGTSALQACLPRIGRDVRGALRDMAESDIAGLGAETAIQTFSRLLSKRAAG